MTNKTAREIIIHLIDSKKITGEEAYTLIYELLKPNTLSTTTYCYSNGSNVPNTIQWEPYTTTTTNELSDKSSHIENNESVL